MGCCEPRARGCRLFLLILLAAAIACSIMTLIGCNFMYFKSIKVGLYKYTGLDGTCQEYSSELPFTAGENTARYCGAIAAAVGCATFILFACETVGFEFTLGKIFESLGCTIAMLSQWLTFALMGSPFCETAAIVGDAKDIDSLEDVKNLLDEMYNDEVEGACEFGTAAFFSMAATGLFMITAIMSCTLHRPEPIPKE